MDKEQELRDKIKEDSSSYDNLKQYLEDIQQHGCVSGMVSDLIYYDDTVKFYNYHKHDIWDRLFDESKQENTTIMGVINNLNGVLDVGSETQLFNLLAWWYYESICFEMFLDIEESKEVE